MNCKNCGCEIYNIMEDGASPEDWVHEEHDYEMYKCKCGCEHPEPELGKCSFAGCSSKAKENCYGSVEYEGAGRVIFPLCENHKEVIDKVKK